MTLEKEAAHKTALTLALQKDYAVLKAEKSNANTMEVTISITEDSFLFNADKGVVFSHKGSDELDILIDNERKNIGSNSYCQCDFQYFFTEERWNSLQRH